jgi:phosphoesterase RecJ-like protein
MIDFEKLKDIILTNNSFLLTTHVNPDADGIGSEIALYLILKQLDKKIYIINHSNTPYNLEFLDIDKQIKKYNDELHKNIFNEVDVLIALDFNRSDRIVSMQNEFIRSAKLKVCIDHHQEPENFADYFFTDTSYSATGHIIYDFIKRTNIVTLNHEIAYEIYAAIMTDTGSFRFERTTPELHRIIAELLELNINPGEVYDKLYDQSKFSKIKLLGTALQSIKLFGKEQRIAFMVLRQSSLEELNAVESDTENFVNYTLSIEGVVIGIFFIELKQGFKVSFRSKGNIPINKLAGEYGGGGHINAAGVRFFRGSMDEFIPKILEKAETYLLKFSNLEV